MNKCGITYDYPLWYFSLAIPWVWRWICNIVLYEANVIVEMDSLVEELIRYALFAIPLTVLTSPRNRSIRIRRLIKNVLFFCHPNVSNENPTDCKMHAIFKFISFFEKLLHILNFLEIGRSIWSFLKKMHYVMRILPIEFQSLWWFTLGEAGCLVERQVSTHFRNDITPP